MIFKVIDTYVNTLCFFLFFTNYKRYTFYHFSTNFWKGVGTKMNK